MDGFILSSSNQCSNPAGLERKQWDYEREIEPGRLGTKGRRGNSGLPGSFLFQILYNSFLSFPTVPFLLSPFIPCIKGRREGKGLGKEKELQIKGSWSLIIHS